LLGLDDEESVFLAEESLQDLLELPVTAKIMESELDADEYIEIDKGLGLALRLEQPADTWLLLTDRYSDRKLLSDHIQRLKGERRLIGDVKDDDFFLALAEYFSISLRDELLCEQCTLSGGPLYVEARISRLEAFLEERIPQGSSILEICCGSGTATQALHRLGHSPLCMDSDPCDLCQALKCETMDPRKCFVIDARHLPRFLAPRSIDVVAGFMVGLIEDFNWPLWKEILLRSSEQAKDQVLFTTYTQKEAALIAKAFEDAGFAGEVIDNRDSSGIYDQWAYLGLREGRRKG